MKIRFLTMVLIIFATIYAHAGSISCTTATGLVPDGSVLDFDSVQASTDSWYRFTAAAGRSYSIAVRDDLDLDNPDLAVTFYGNNTFPPSDCSSSSLTPLPAGSGYTDTTTTEPALPANAKRASIVTPSSFTGVANTYWIDVHNGSNTTSHYVSVSVTETTIYSPTWTTTSNFATQWTLLNTTSQAVKFTITLTSTSGSSPVTYATTLLTLGAPSSSTSDQILNTGSGFSPTVPSGANGYVILTHNGPPGAVQAYADEYNFVSYASPLLIPVPIGPIRGK